jgi:hypothetical protein
MLPHLTVKCILKTTLLRIHIMLSFLFDSFYAKNHTVDSLFLNHFAHYVQREDEDFPLNSLWVFYEDVIHNEVWGLELSLSFTSRTVKLQFNVQDLL